MSAASNAPAPSVVAVMPCLGRPTQTVQVIERLFLTADFPMRLVCVVDDHQGALANTLLGYAEERWAELNWRVDVLLNQHRLGYWRSMSVGANYASDSPLIANLANDVWAGRSWLARSLALAHSMNGDQIVGYNDGFHTEEQAAHFIAPRSLLRLWYGEALFPIEYRHNFGDTEIVERAKRAHLYRPAPYAVLYHNHPVNGAAYDETYRLASEDYERDSRLYQQRMNQLGSKL